MLEIFQDFIYNQENTNFTKNNQTIWEKGASSDWHQEDIDYAGFWDISLPWVAFEPCILWPNSI